MAAFGLTIAGSFHFDDYSLFSDPAITSPAGWYEVWRPLQTRPLTWLTFWLNYQTGGTNPVGYHLVNLALHLAAALLVLATARRLLPDPAGLIAAILFAVHPFQTEAVAYVFARGTLLCTVLCLAAFWYWLEERPWIAVLVFAAALLAKEECAAFPLFLWIAVPSSRRRYGQFAAMVALAFAAGLRVIWAAGVIYGSGVGSQAAVSPLGYLSVQGAVIVRYLAMLLVPWGYTIDPEITAGIAWRAGAWVLIGLAVAAALRWRRAGLWFLAGLVLLAPSSSIFPATDLAADRRMYLPMVAFSAFAAVWMGRWPKFALAAIFIILCSISVRYSLVWRSERSLWTEAVGRAPGKVRPRIQLSRALDPADALGQLQIAQRMAPADPRVFSEQGRVWLELGRPGEALAAFGRVLALAPRDANAVNNRGVALQALGQTDAARLDFERALRLDPCLFDARLNLRRVGGTPPPASCRFTPGEAAQLR